MVTSIVDFDAVLARHGLDRDGFCARLNLGLPTFRSWVRGDRKPSIQVCQRAEQVLGIGKHELRPDLWTPPPRQRRRALAAA